jgi:hypothetical protein
MWDRLGARQRDLPQPRIIDYSLLEDADRLAEPSAPAVAVVEHTWSAEPDTAHFLQGAVVAHNLPVVCEPGYGFSLASAPSVAGTGSGGAGSAQVVAVQINPTVAQGASTTVSPGSSRGPRIAVLDTGRRDVTQPKMIDLLPGQPITVSPADDHGHGTAVAKIIEAINPSAKIEVLRVVRQNLTTSAELLAALNYTLFAEKYDVINASLSADLSGGCPTLLGSSMHLLLSLCRQNNTALPKLIAAAGNTTSGHSFGYPARMPGAIVVLAWDATNQPASYNVAVPTHGVQTEYAFGGAASPSLGEITLADGSKDILIGTSFAAAVVTGTVTA